MKKFYLMLVILFISTQIFAQKKQKNKESSETKTTYKSGTFSGLKFRNIGPAFNSGRISDIAVNPNNHAQYYITVACGGVWKTDNAGTTFRPIFDSQKSYSVGCITIDPSNEHTIWVGTGENNNQRSVAYGDGVYKSEDGGNTWKNMGLKTSEHIHKIIVHPKNSNVVYVAANGPLWRSGGNRGIYKSTNGGETWKQVLSISDDTGFCDLIMDPRNPDVLYAAAHQRRRHVWTYLGGGPESGLHKTTDGGSTWKKINSGLPGVDKGRIGLAISPVNPDVLYAIVEAAEGKGGFYRSTNRGASWEKRSSYNTSGNYYQEIYCDLYDVDKIYSMNTWLHHSEDGGKTFKRTGEKSKHVDNHAMWQDPNNPKHWRVGCDGGLYETWDAAQNWQFKANLPLTQFYKVAVDNAYPFYNVYGGTQDNNSLGGPSRTLNNAGIINMDWFVTNGGDGFESQIDPTNPDIVYAQAQYGWLVRFDKKSGERVFIQPQEGKDDKALRWNWDAPLLISPHNPKRLYFGANVLFQSDDRGDTWKAISGDLTTQIDRNKLPVMGKVWGMDAVRKNLSTSIYCNLVALDESPLQAGLIYVGTDDGLIQVTEDGGNNWRKISSFPGIPERTYVNQVIASKHDANVVFAVFNNHKNGDFKPYVLKSTDKGKTWQAIQSNLPEKGTVYTIAQDHQNKDLLFVGTEFGVFFTVDGGKEWTQLKAGLPTIAIKDIAIQERENDLVLASFGRSFYVLDDYSALREVNPELLKKEAHLFKIKKGLMFIESSPLGTRGKASQGESFFTAPNPPVGATFTFYLKDKIKTQKQIRKEKEKELAKDNQAIPYPSFEEMRAEDNEEKPYLLFVVKDSNGDEVSKIKSSPKKGISRVVWNFRYATTTPIQLRKSGPGRYSPPNSGQMALPGTYSVTVYKSVNGEISELLPAQNFEIEALNNKTLPAQDKAAVLAFQKNLAELRRSVRGAGSLKSETDKRISHIKAAVQTYPSAPLQMMQSVKVLEGKMQDIAIQLYGDNSLSSRQFETKTSILTRLEWAVYSCWYNSSAPTKTSLSNYEIAKSEYEELIGKLHSVVKDVEKLEKQLDAAKVPYTPGRDSDWREH